MFWYCHQSHFRFDQSLLFSHAKSCDGSILCPWLFEVNPQWHRGAGEPEIGRALPKIKQTYEEMIDFIAKKVENMLRFKFWRWHLYFIFVSSGVEYCSRKDLLLANCMMKLKREIISTLKLKISVGVLYLMASLAVLPMVGAARRSAMPDTHLPWWLLLSTLRHVHIFLKLCPSHPQGQTGPKDNNPTWQPTKMFGLKIMIESYVESPKKLKVQNYIGFR